MGISGSKRDFLPILCAGSAEEQIGDAEGFFM
jgi:hypothetical protein